MVGSWEGGAWGPVHGCTDVGILLELLLSPVIGHAVRSPLGLLPADEGAGAAEVGIKRYAAPRHQVEVCGCDAR